MGYTTDFSGALGITPYLKQEHIEYLQEFAGTRRMKRDPAVVETLNDPYRKAVGLPVGCEGEFFVGADVNKGDIYDHSVVDHNRPPKTQPGLWCKWTVDNMGRYFEWNGEEKFYDYIEWLDYLITNFYEPWGYKLNGDLHWVGEDSEDFGSISVVNNVISVSVGEKHYKDPEPFNSSSNLNRCVAGKGNNDGNA